MSLGIAVFHREFKKVGLCAYNMGYQDEPRPKAYSARYTQQQNPHLVFDFKVLPRPFCLLSVFSNINSTIIQQIPNPASSAGIQTRDLKIFTP